MKRVGNLYKNVWAYDNLKLAHKNARAKKGWYKEVREVDADLENRLYKIQTMLVHHLYVTSPYEMFYKQEGPKLRKIYKLPYYPDRIVQWALMQVVSPHIEKNLIRDTFSAIPGRGIHDGLHRVQDAMYNHKEDCLFCLKFDIRHYYQSIVHDLLKQSYEKMFKDPEILDLVFGIIDSINTLDEEDKDEMRSLGLEVNDECGIPIGNFFSQWSGNFFLSQFDHWVKESLGVKFYFRYMDDIVLFGDDKEKLKVFRSVSEEYLWDKLKLRMKPNWQIFPSFVRGVDFLGYRVFDGYTLLRNGTKKSMKRRYIDIDKKVSKGQYMNYTEFSSLNSYMGWGSQADCFRLTNKYIVKPFEDAACRYYRDVILKGA